MIYLKLFWDFFKVSCFTFGGAYGAIPLIRDMVLRCGWLSEDRLSYIIAVSESTPGPIMVNMATYIGSDQAGFWGALIATFAVVLPAYLVILIVTTLLKTAVKNPYVQAVLGVLKPCVVGIVAATGLYMTARLCLPLTPGSSVDLRALLVIAGLVASMVFYRHVRKQPLSPIALIVISAVLGVLIF